VTARVFLACFVVVTASAAPVRWLRLSSPAFEIYTDAGEASARRILARFEVARQVFGGAEVFPVRIVVFSREKDFRLFRPADTVTGFYQSGPERDYIAMLDTGPEVRRVAMHEYAHLIFNHLHGSMPQWLEEGLAEFYSTLETQGSNVILGAPVRAHLRVLDTSPWLDANTLEAVDQGSPYYNESGKTGILYAESWALAHLLNLAPAYRGGMAGFLAAIESGMNAGLAFEKAFGKPMQAAIQDLRGYAGERMPTATAISPKVETASRASASAATEADVMEVQAELLLAVGRNEQAGAFYRNLAAKYPDSPQAATGLATLALRARHFDDAAKQFGRAIDLGARDGGTYFEYAMLLRETHAPREQVTDYLNKAVAASPGLAEAHFLLGVRASDDGDFAAAVEHLRRAARILPRQVYFWHALAMAYNKLGDTALSRDAAQHALQAARTEQEQAMAHAAMRLSRPEDSAVKKPSVHTPASWDNPKGDARIEGRLTRVDCEGTTARLLIAGQTLVVSDPSRVLLTGTPGAKAELHCGSQDVAAAIEYKSSSNEVTAIDFR
jgi:Flp pilus assembly protein TadD